MCCCFRFFAEKLSKPPEEPQPTSPAKKNSSKKRIMSFIGGMPYRKLYVPQLPLGEKRIIGYGAHNYPRDFFTIGWEASAYPSRALRIGIIYSYFLSNLPTSPLDRKTELPNGTDDCHFSLHKTFARHRMGEILISLAI